jgi:hypothetical protein
VKAVKRWVKGGIAMKLRKLLCFIIPLSILCSCSKPEPPVAKPPAPPKKKTAQVIQNIKTTPADTQPQAMADIRVIDADNGRIPSV